MYQWEKNILTHSKTRKTYWLLPFDFELIRKQSNDFRFFSTTVVGFFTALDFDLTTREEIVMSTKNLMKKVKNTNKKNINFLPFFFHSRWRIKNFVVRHPNSYRSDHIFLDLIFIVWWWKRPDFCRGNMKE